MNSRVSEGHGRVTESEFVCAVQPALPTLVSPILLEVVGK